MAITIGNTVHENAGFSLDDPELIVKVDAIDGDGFHRELVYTGKDIPEAIMEDLAALEPTEETEPTEPTEPAEPGTP